MSDRLFDAVRRDDGVVSLRIATDQDRHLSTGWVDGFLDRLREIERDASTRVVILEGSESYFSAGASLSSLTRTTDPRTTANYAATASRALLDLSIPVVAAASGHAIGGGLVLALWCDAVVLGAESLYGANFTSNGFTPGMGATHVVLEAFGESLGRELLYTGRLMTGEEIRRATCPISHAVHPRAVVMERALSVAREITLTPGPTGSLLKRLLAGPRIDSLERALTSEEDARARLAQNPGLEVEIASRYPASPGGLGFERDG